MNTMPTPTAAAGSSNGRLWRIRGGVLAAGAVLLGAVAFGATAASADSQSPSPAPGASSAQAPAAGSGKVMAQAKHPFARALRSELRVDIRAGEGFGDKAHAIAYVLIRHTDAFGKLPANLQTDLKTLEAAAATDRDSDAAKIKDTALNGGYGDQIQKMAKSIQAKAAQAPAKP